MDWDKLRIFHAVADAGSLTHAGDTLHLSQSAVSRQVRALEESLNTILFHRHARGLILTEQGELLFDATRSITKRLDAASARIRDSEEEVFGELRVTTTIGLGSLWLAPRLSKLYDDYPDLNIDLMLDERVLDLPMREADVAIRMKEPSQADLVRKKLMSVQMQLFASPQYSYDLPNLLTVNNYFGCLQAVHNHLGIGILPDYVAIDDPNLVRVLPEIESNDVPVFLAYPEELRHSKRISAFRDFVVSEINLQRKRAAMLRFAAKFLDWPQAQAYFRREPSTAGFNLPVGLRPSFALGLFFRQSLGTSGDFHAKHACPLSPRPRLS